jgi:hypothetical protein
MPIYDFSDKQLYVTIDNNVQDNRTDAEKDNSALNIYNPQNPDIAYAERMVEEAVNLAGAPVTVFKRMHHGSKDEVWEEDPDPTYARGVKLKGFFAPNPAEIQMTKWGIDTPNQLIINFSRAVVFKLFSFKMISEGDVLIVPHNTLTVVQNVDLREGIGNRLDRYRVIKSTDTGNYKYRWLYWTCTLENITGDVSVDVNFSKEYA